MALSEKERDWARRWFAEQILTIQPGNAESLDLAGDLVATSERDFKKTIRTFAKGLKSKLSDRRGATITSNQAKLAAIDQEIASLGDTD